MDERHFSTLDQCSDEYDPSLDFPDLKSGYHFTPKRRWCLFAEIMEFQHFSRLRLRVKDRSGKKFPIAFDIEDDERSLDYTRFQKCRMVVILCAEQHGCLDMKRGIRQESTGPIEMSRLHMILWQL
jgi:hypothetical protein